VAALQPSSLEGAAAGPAEAASFQLHRMDPAWRHQPYLQQQRQAGRSWRQLFWETWGLTSVLFCHACEEFFPACEANCCRCVAALAEGMPAWCRPAGLRAEVG
jgi:hypothetical protein